MHHALSYRLSTLAPFFFSRSGDLRDLHSFPTRRSSDLLGARRLQEIARLIKDRRLKRHAAGFRQTGFKNIGGAVQVALGMAADQDRKSTRLNSSHVKISYAVFCLKKKKKKNNTCVR